MGLSLNGTCNSTLDDMRIGPSEENIVGNITFHNLAIIISAACSLFAILTSFYLIWMHALHYTKPTEQRHIIRILFMIPVYAAASFLSLYYYWHAVYFQVISDCYEAFAIASFFALLCHYIAPNLHDQKEYFRGIIPKPWVMPINWFQKCCGGRDGRGGPWRTPRSGLTWFNVIWSGVYQYCFIRVAMTITAVVTQYFGKYCESSNSPIFAHIWVLVIESIAVTIAMYCLIQFYIQLRVDLAPYQPFLKVVAIKLVIFLSFWQSFVISILTSPTLNIITATKTIAYPDIKVGIPSMLLCIEMAIFAILHLFAFPWRPYRVSSENTLVGPKQGGFLGVKALLDSMNPWDLVKGFARGTRWLFVGRKVREQDMSYKNSSFANVNDVTLEPTAQGYKSDSNLPIAKEFRRSNFGNEGTELGEGAGLIAHAQPNPLNPRNPGDAPAHLRYEQDITTDATRYGYNDEEYGNAERYPSPSRQQPQSIGMAFSEPQPYPSHVVQQPYASQASSQAYLDQLREERRHKQKPSEAWAQSKRPATPEDYEDEPETYNASWDNRPGPSPQPPHGGQF
ncbi:organic solute transporter Ostalpha-domain-containing protein [Xylogone sp. PMI_703]|nr:organic solute transporter Ostalpha-domain-containing protein [Xylogone sp. PMI_703]